MPEKDLAAVAAWANERVPQLAETSCRRTLEQIPFYAESNAVPDDDLRRSIRRNLEFLVGALLLPEEIDPTVPRQTGHRRARQGAPLSEVLRCYRLCFTTLWEALVAHARSAESTTSPAVLLDAAGDVLQISDRHATVLSEAYRETTAEMLISQHQRRSALVEALLTGAAVAEGGCWEAATLLGMPADSSFAVVAAETRGLATVSLPEVEKRLSAEGMVSAWRLSPGQQLGLVALRPAQVQTLLHTLRAVATARTGVSPLYRGLTDTPRSLRLAQSALVESPAGQADVRMFSPNPLDALLALMPAESARMAVQTLGPVLQLRPDDRDALLSTLTAYLDEGGAEQAAEVLFCHANTVRYRLKRLQELTGLTLSEPRDLAVLTAANRALKLQVSEITRLLDDGGPRAIR